jgi:hypothetical protein
MKRIANMDYFYVNKKKARRCLKRLLIVAALLLLLAAILVPQYSDYIRVTLITRLYGELRRERVLDSVGKQLKENPQSEIVPETADLIPAVSLSEKGIPARLDYKTVTRDGVIIVVSAQYGVLIRFYPEIKAGEFAGWSCQISSLRGNGLKKAGNCLIHTLED